MSRASTIGKWAERVYAETDFGRSIATSIAGAIGLALYVLLKDVVIAVFSSIITFPIVRIVSTGFHGAVIRRQRRKREREDAVYTYDQLSEGEKEVVAAFVDAGGSVMTWSHINRLSLPGPSIESLVQRELLWTSVMADGMTETFALKSAIFDAARQRMRRETDSDQ